MGGFLKNLKGLFIATDEELMEAERKKSGQPGHVTQNSSSEQPKTEEKVVLNKRQLTEGGEGKVNQKFLDILLESITNNNQEGFDYLEYKQAMQSLKKMEMDEETRYKSAFAMAQTMGASKGRLLETGDVYLKVLKSEEEKFMISVSNQRQSKIDERRQELLNIDKWIKEKEAEIEKIKAQIAKKRSSKDNFEKELSETSKKIETVQNDFEATYQFLSSQIQDDLNRIKKYLK